MADICLGESALHIEKSVRLDLSRRVFLRSGVAAGLVPLLPRRASPGEEQAYGKLLITGFRGLSPSDPEVVDVQRYLESGAIGGVLLLGRNIESPDQLRRLTAAIRSAGPDLPPIISIDQEGGRVSRLRAEQGFLPWMSAKDIRQSGMQTAEIFDYYLERAMELANLGVNLNFAPVVDLDLNAENPIIGAIGRSFGAGPDEVVAFATSLIQAHRTAGVATCLKHFPGHGSSVVDSHADVVDITGIWQEKELAPFARLIESGLADAVMTGHLAHRAMSDAPDIPMSLSKKGLAILRKDLGFLGPVFSDDMVMGAIGNRFSLPEAAAMALNAGTTFLIYSNYRAHDRIETVIEIAKTLVYAKKDNRLNQEILEAQIATAARFRASLV